jgi:hypothetical protein
MLCQKLVRGGIIVTSYIAEETNKGGGNVKVEKKVYSSPKLTIHGTLATITLGQRVRGGGDTRAQFS